MIFFFAFLLVRRIFKVDGIVVMPFETPIGESEYNYNGKAISDLLTGELQRILMIHNLTFEELSLELERLIIPKIIPKSETLEYSIAHVGTVGAGSISLSLGRLIIVLKRMCPGCKPVPIITGSIQRYGSLIIITACLEDHEVRTWDVRRVVRGEKHVLEEHVPNLVRDLSFKIVYDMAKGDAESGVSAETWEGLKYFTEALVSYHHYIRARDIKHLDLAKNNCLKAVYSERNYDKAIMLLSDLGFIYIDKKKYIEAQKLLGHVGAFKPDISAFGNGLICDSQGRLVDGLDAYNKAIGINPQYAEAWYNKGNTLGELGKHIEAIKAYERAIEIKPGIADPWVNKGVALYKLGEHEKAIIAYDRAIEINPTSIEAWCNKALSLRELGRMEDVVIAYDMVIKINPNLADAWCYKGAALGELGKLEEAVKALDKAIEIDPQHVMAWAAKGVALSELNKSDEALQAFDKAIELDPHFAEAQYNKGTALAKLDKQEEALEALDKAIDIDPQFDTAWVNKGIALNHMGKPEEALKAFEKAIEINPNLTEAWCNKGVALKALRRDAEASVVFAKAKELRQTGGSQNKSS